MRSPRIHKPLSLIEDKLDAYDKLVSRLAMNSETKCFEYTGSISYAGYGQIFVEGRTWAAHRLMWQLINGEIPPFEDCEGGRYFVLHHCDNPKCCNPDHLYLGSSADNAEDMSARKRCRYGDRGLWRRSDEKRNKRYGRVYWKIGGEIKTLKEWAERYGVHPSTLDQRLSAGWPEHLLGDYPCSGNRYRTGKASYERYSGDEEARQALRQSQEAATGKAA